MSTVDGSLYTGQSRDLGARLKRHNSGKVKGSRARAQYQLAYFEEYPTRAEAMWREWELKTNWNTEQEKTYLLV